MFRLSTRIYLLFFSVILSFQTSLLIGQELPCIPPKELLNRENLTEEERERIKENEQRLDEFSLTNANSLKLLSEKKTIPVVVHLFHQGGEENLSNEEVTESIETLNAFFRGDERFTSEVDSFFKARIAENLNIEFRLAEKTPDGSPTNGINRIYSEYTSNGSTHNRVMKLEYGWDPHQYFNIYVVRYISGALGFAYYPSYVDSEDKAYLDGVVIRAENLNTYALAHEAGHWLNLAHVWGGDVSIQSTYACNYDDHVEDTPNTHGNLDCNLEATSCGSKDNVQNIMDYTDCSLMFTQGQGERMLACLASPVAHRNNLWSAENIAKTFYDVTEPKLILSTYKLQESYDKLGVFEDSITIDLVDLSFSENSNILNNGNEFTLNNLPEGLNAEIKILNSTQAILNINGVATNHDNEDVLELTITFSDNAFQSVPTSNIIGNNPTFSLEFYDHTRRKISSTFNRKVNTCKALFTDQGGIENNYNTHANGYRYFDYDVTFYSSEEGKDLEVYFTDFDIKTDVDYLYVYNGESSEAPEVIGSPFTGWKDDFKVISNNAKGALTFRFVIDNYSYSKPSGWRALVNCIESTYIPSLSVSEEGIHYVNDTLFTDAGGVKENYNPDDDSYRITLFPKEQGKELEVVFKNFDTMEGKDKLYVYNGGSSSAAQVKGSPFSGTLDEFKLKANNPDGALTFYFTEPYYSSPGTYTGWEANVYSVDSTYMAPIRITDGGTVSIYDTLFTDAGGFEGNHNREKAIITFLPIEEGKALEVTFNDYYLTNTSQSISIYNGTSNTARKFTSPSSNTAFPYTVKANNPDGALTFEITGGQGRGWDASIQSVESDYIPPIRISDGGSVYLIDSVFTDSGGLHEQYKNNEDYTITLFPLEEGKALEVDFEYLEVLYYWHHRYDSLTIYNGTSTNDPIVFREPYFESSNVKIKADNAEGALTFRFKSNSIDTYQGWKADVKSVQNLYQPAVRISDTDSVTVTDTLFCDSGGYTNNYLKGENYTLTMYSKEKNKDLEVTFNKFNIESNEASLFVYNGNSTSALQFEGSPFTGNLENLKIKSDNAEGVLTFRFVSNSSNSSEPKAGWEASVKSIESTYKPSVRISDGGTITTSDTLFTDSGGFDRNYLDYQYHTITFLPEEENKAIKATFNKFELGEKAFLHVYQGITGELREIKGSPFTGTLDNFEVIANNTQGALTFKFKSEWKAIPSTGWEATISSIDTPYLPPVKLSDTDTLISCSRLFSDSGGFFANHSNNESDTLTILPPEKGKAVQVHFNKFFTYDTLFIYNGSSVDAPQINYSPLIGRYFQHYYETYYDFTVNADNEEGALTFRFVSNGSNTYEGWDAEISCIPNLYQPVLNISDTNSISVSDTTFTDTGGLNGNYAFNEFETITISAAEKGKALEVTFNKFKTESYDKLKIYNGSSAKSPQLENSPFSGELDEFTVQSDNPDGVLTFVFSSSYFSSSPGWEASITNVENTYLPSFRISDKKSLVSCDTLFTDSGGLERGYTANENYTTTIYPAEEGKALEVTFNEFELGEFDYLYVYNGDSTNALQVEGSPFSGKLDKFKVTSDNAEGVLTFKFRSNSTDHFSGWKADVNCVESEFIPAIYISDRGTVVACDTLFTDAGGVKGRYGRNENYIITLLPADSTKALELVFEEFEINESDELYVYNGTSTSALQLEGSPFKGSIENLRIIADNEEGALTFRFKSDYNDLPLSGWKADVNCVESEFIPAIYISDRGTVIACDTLFTDAGGVKGRYSNYENHTITLFPADSTKALEVLFEEFDINESDELYIYNGTSTSALQVEGSPFNGNLEEFKVTADNKQGALTFKFKSHYKDTPLSGWKANVNCVESEFIPAVYISDEGTVVACDTLFTDAGGVKGRYGKSENYTVTLFPADSTKALEVVFEEFEINSYDDLYVFNGTSTKAPQLEGSPFNGNLEEFKVASDNKEGALTFKFESSSSYNSTPLSGWKANVNCTESSFKPSIRISDGGSFVVSDTLFTDSGGFDSDYTKNEDYTVTLLPSGEGQAIQVSFSEFDLERYDRLHVYNGTSTYARQIEGSPFEGSLEELTLIPDNKDGALTFRFISNNVRSKGWTASVNCIENPYVAPVIISKDNFVATCGNMFFDSGGEFGKYSNDEDHTVTIFPSESGKVVEVTFIDFSTRSLDDLYVYNGVSTSARKFENYRLTGSYKNVTFRATNQDGALTFHFKSSSVNTYPGWKAEINCVNGNGQPSIPISQEGTVVTCDTLFTDSGGLSASHVENKDYTITFLPSGENNAIQADFDRFYIDESSSLYVYNGTSSSSGQLKGSPFTGHLQSLNLKADNPDGALTFRCVSKYRSFSGWKANISCIPNTYVRPLYISDSSSAVVCEQRFVDSGGAYLPYMNNEKDTITLYPSGEGKAIEVSFIDFHTQENKDSLYIYNGTSTASPQVEGSPFHGKLSEFTLTADNSEGALTFLFFSDSMTENLGWEADINCVDNPYVPAVRISDGGSVVVSDTLFTDAGGVNYDYQNSSEHFITLYPSGAGKKLEIDFEAFKTEYLMDFLYIYNGSSTDAPQVNGSPFSGEVDNLTIIANNEEGALTFKFKSNRFINDIGWIAHIVSTDNVYTPSVRISDGGSVIVSDTLFTDSGGFIEGYGNNEHNIITLQPPNEEQSLDVSFEQFSTEYLKDFLYVYNGSSVEAKQIEGSPFSGEIDDLKIEANNLEGALTFRFISNQEQISQGWEARVNIVENPLALENTLEEVKVFPNPSTGIIYISHKYSNLPKIQLRNLLGKVLEIKKTVKHNDTIDISNLPSGIYFIEINHNGILSTRKVTKL